MIPEPRIAFCITCKGRTPHLKITLARNLADNAEYANAVFVVLDYSSPDDLVEWLVAEHSPAIQAGRVVVYSYPGAPAFHMAHAKNLAHRAGIREGADWLVNLDADNLTGPGFASFLGRSLAGAGDYAGIGRMVAGVTPRGVTGRLVIHREAFLKVGGYDERFGTWSPDDKDFDHRLRRLGLTRHELPDRFIDCIRHNDRMRFRDYPEARQLEAQYYEQEVKEASHTVANNGRFGVGAVIRNFEEPVLFEPLPTRVFGIGLHKTGTTSLAQALNLLGFDCAHWPSAHWARGVYNQMQAGRSLFIEQHSAATDLPIALLYRALDEAYPGSKFILTLRSTASWLASAAAHWDPTTNPFRGQWDTDPFTHKVHTLLYGRRKFDAEIFAERYRRHTQEVLEYFKYRPTDLLVLNLRQARPWKPLCDFLRVPVPPVPYPKANGTSEVENDG